MPVSMILLLQNYNCCGATVLANINLGQCARTNVLRIYVFWPENNLRHHPCKTAVLRALLQYLYDPIVLLECYYTDRWHGAVQRRNPDFAG